MQFAVTNSFSLYGNGSQDDKSAIGKRGVNFLSV